MNYINLIATALVLGLLAYFYNANLSLKKEVQELNNIQRQILTANNNFKTSIENLNSSYKKELAILAELKGKKDKEIHYVTTIKERIIKDNNSTCIDAINSIYARLFEQTRNLDSSANKQSK